MKKRIELAAIASLAILAGSTLARAQAVEIFAGDDAATVDVMFFNYFKDGVGQPSPVLLFHRSRVLVDYDIDSSSRRNLPQFGMTNALSYNPEAWRGFAPVAAVSIATSVVAAKVGLQYARVRPTRPRPRGSSCAHGWEWTWPDSSSAWAPMFAGPRDRPRVQRPTSGSSRGTHSERSGDGLMKIAFIGYGNVGAPLADHLQRLGHQVTLAASDASSEGVRKARARNASLEVAPINQAAMAADVVFLATPFQANEGVLKAVGDALNGKILVDCTNPVGPGLTHGLKNVQSGSEMVQALVPGAKVVKAFTIYGFENLENHTYPAYHVKPVMMYCGNDAPAKKTVGALIAELGWDPLDVGGLEQALHLEHMTLLWVRMVRVNGVTPQLVWAALRR